MAASPDYSHFVKTDVEGRSRLDLAIDGITCAACLDDIETAMKRLPGVMLARLNLTSHRLAVTFDSARIDAGRLTGALEAIGYRAYPYEQRKFEADEAARFKLLLKCFGVAAFAAMNIMLLSISIWSSDGATMPQETRDFFHMLSALIALPAAAYAGQPFYTSALTRCGRAGSTWTCRSRIGVFLALALSVYETRHHAAARLFRFGDHAAGLSAGWARARSGDAPQDPRGGRQSGGAQGRKRLAAAAGRRATGPINVGPCSRRGAGGGGSRAGALRRAHSRRRPDRTGRERGGRKSAITGETLMKPVRAGDMVYAGSINGEGALTLRVTAAGHAALIDEAARLIEAASAARSRYMQLSERVSRYYAPVVHLAALTTGLVWYFLLGANAHDAMVIAISVLIITCPCALALAVPTVQAMASGAFFRAGLFLNDAAGMEKLGEIDTVVFDKTGTLTLPEPRVSNRDEVAPDLLQLAARLARSSHHPLALALARSVTSAAPLADAAETAGQGVSAPYDGGEVRLGSAGYCGVEAQPFEGEGSAMFVRHGERWARLLIRQTLRPDAKDDRRGPAQKGF